MKLEEMKTPDLIRLRGSGILGAVALEKITEVLDRRQGRPSASRPRRLADALDSRPEEEIRAELKQWATLKGAAAILDTEQGYRPDDCPHCRKSLGKGARTRVTEGTPDLFVIWRPEVGGGIWLVEAKSAVGVQSPAQRELEAECTVGGVTYVLARGVEDLEKQWRQEDRPYDRPGRDEGIQRSACGPEADSAIRPEAAEHRPATPARAVGR